MYSHIKNSFSSLLLGVAILLIFMPVALSSGIQVVPKGSSNTETTTKDSITKERYHQEFRHAVQSYRNILRKNWPEAEISSQHRLVLYPPDFSEKRVIDFKQNEFQVTLPTERKGNVVDYQTMQIRLNQAVIELLTLDLISAIESDPINIHMQTLSGIRYANQIGRFGRDRLMRELFRDERPNIKTIQRMAEKLTKGAYIRYPAVASLNLSFVSQERTTYIVPLPKQRPYQKAKIYEPIIEKTAKSVNVPSHLLLSIMHMESYFNPLARSLSPSFGLMQVNPMTAGLISAEIELGKQTMLTPAQLYNPETNILMGATYLSYLYTDILKGIKSPTARMYCTIAAYTSDYQTVLNTLTGIRQVPDAVPSINRLSDKAVLGTLLRDLPDRQHRDYLHSVLNIQRKYR